MAYTLTEGAVQKLAADHRRLLQLAQNSRQGMPSVPAWDMPDAPLLFRNNSSSTIPAFGVVRVVDQIGTAPQQMIKGDQPSTTFSRLYLVNGPAPVPKDALGVAQKGPFVYFAYDSGTPAMGDGWGAKPSQWTASKNYPSCLSAIGVLDSDNKIAYGHLQPINVVIGKLSGSLSQGSNAAVNVWGGAGNSETVITSLQITGYDWLMKSGATAIASGKKVVCQWINGIWYVTEAECA